MKFTTLVTIAFVVVLLSSFSAAPTQSTVFVKPTGPPCDNVEVGECMSALPTGQKPTAKCCGQLKAQVPSCYCAFIKNPTLRKFVTSPDVNRVLAQCGIRTPSTC
ncbi:unnamed protein product [Microthlaspi erraticum]|uniref:Bifunctional inhibitor/plant lipid transfer protein/seed storage helical domain-containing protein n=1 Tax=Microthlaspi erraticum TaxID=1685480 RepID=A0A6D2KHZ8_9BRAS|nr:unnamed protein product [Microthlaspi erraticum]